MAWRSKKYFVQLCPDYLYSSTSIFTIFYLQAFLHEMYISRKKHWICKKIRFSWTYTSITYLTGLHVVGITGLFRANWLVARCQPAASPIGIQLTGGEMGKPCIPPPPLYEGEQPGDLAGFLDSAQAELSYDIHPTPLQSVVYWVTHDLFGSFTCPQELTRNTVKETLIRLITSKVIFILEKYLVS